MMIDPILNTAPVCQGIRLASLSIGLLQTDDVVHLGAALR